MTIIPQELIALPRWVLWKLEERDGKSTKVPYQKNGHHASSTDSSTWTTMAGLRGADRSVFTGFGFVLGSPYTGIDLDKCRDADTGDLEPWAQEIVTSLNSFTEISPSGRGLHIFIKGNLPAGRNRRGKLEAYSTGRYFTMTGNHLAGTPESIREISDDELTAWHDKYLLTAEPSATTTATASADTSCSAKDFKAACEVWKQLGAGATDDDVRLEFFKRVPLRDKLNREDYLRRTIQAARDKVFPATEVTVVELEVPEVAEEPLPALPHISGPLSELAHAVAPDLPYDLKIASAMTFLGLAAAGRFVFEDAWYHEPRFYTCMVCDPGLGKTPAWTEIEAALSHLLDKHEVHRLHSVETGPALTMHLNEHPRTILVPDEFSLLFGKGASQQTANGPTKSLMGEMLKLYEKHNTSNTARKNVEEVGKREVSVTDARLAAIGGVPTDEFPNIWSGTSGASTGLQDRTSLFTTTQTTLPAVQRPTDRERATAVIAEIEANIRSERTVTRPPAVAALLNEWWNTTEPKLKGTRAGQRVKGFVDKYLLLQCALQGRGAATVELAREAIQVGEYQIILKQRLMPEDASSWVSTAENKLLAYVKRQGKTGATMTNAINAIHPARCGGYGVAVRAWKNIIEANQIVQDRKVGTGGKPRVYWTATST